MEPHSPELHSEPRGVAFFESNETITPVLTTLGYSEFLSKPKTVTDIDNLHLKNLHLKGRAAVDDDAKELSILGHMKGAHDARIIRRDDIEGDDVLTPGIGDTLYRLSVFLPNYTGEHPITVRASHHGDPYIYEAHLKSLLFEEIEGEEDEDEDREVFHGTTEMWKVIDPKTHHVVAENVDLFAEPDAEALSRLHFTFSQ